MENKADDGVGIGLEYKDRSVSMETPLKGLIQ